MSGGEEKQGKKQQGVTHLCRKRKSCIHSLSAPLFRFVMLFAKRGFTIDKKLFIILFFVFSFK